MSYHSKVNNIKYKELEIHNYLKSPLFEDEQNKLLYTLRTRTLDSVKANFKNQYGGKVDCPLVSWNHGDPPSEDTQQHLLSCPKIKIELKSEEMACENIKYEHLFGNTLQQKEVIVLFTNTLNARENLKKKMTNPPGDNLDPSMGSCLCSSNTFLTFCTNCIINGK